MQNRPGIAILSVGTAVPTYRVKQRDIARWMSAAFTQHPKMGRWVRSVFANAGVETRYACIDDYLLPVAEARFSPGHPVATAPTTAERMAIYEEKSVPLGVAAAQRALAELAEASSSTLHASAASITHVVAVSCTGFFAPGLDLAIARQLGLSLTIGRTMIGFMGCSAAFNGLRTAAQIVGSQPQARVLVVCVELSSLHSQPNPNRENLIAASLFADGASACVVGTPTAEQGNYYLIDDFHTQVKPDTNDEMVWRIGDHGFVLHLSPQIPQHLAQVAPATLDCLFPNDKPQFWAIHPGGPAIVDQLVEVFALAPEQVAASRSVLRHYGNLSSATILFVLDELRQTLQASGNAPTPQTGVAMAFGPGLVMEMARLQYVPLPVTHFSSANKNHNESLLEPA